MKELKRQQEEEKKLVSLPEQPDDADSGEQELRKALGPTPGISRTKDGKIEVNKD